MKCESYTNDCLRGKNGTEHHFDVSRWTENASYLSRRTTTNLVHFVVVIRLIHWKYVKKMCACFLSVMDFPARIAVPCLLIMKVNKAPDIRGQMSRRRGPERAFTGPPFTSIPAGISNYISYTLNCEYWVVRNRYSRLLFTCEDRLCAKLRVQKQSTNSNVTMPVPHVRVTSQINCGDVTMLSQKRPSLATLSDC